MQIGSFDWRWRESLLAVSVNFHAISVLDSLVEIAVPKHGKKFQLLLLQEFALGMATADADGHENGITTVISDALQGSYFFVSEATDEKAAQEEEGNAFSPSAVEAAVEEGRLKKVKRRKKKRGRTRRNREPSVDTSSQGDGPDVVWDPMQMSQEENPPREPRSVAATATTDGQLEDPGTELLIAVEEMSSPDSTGASPPRVPRLIKDFVEVDQAGEKGGVTPALAPTPIPLDTSDRAEAIVESDRLPEPSNDLQPTIPDDEIDQTEVQASPQAESPPTVRVAATIQVASEPTGPKEDAENNQVEAADSTSSAKLLADDDRKESDLGTPNGTAAPPELPSHLKVLNFNFKEGAANDTINVVENNNDEEEKVLIVLPAPAGSSSEEEIGSTDLARPPLVLLASTLAPSTTTTTTEAPTLPPSQPSTTAASPPTSAGLLRLASPTAAPGSAATSTTLDPIRTGMKIIQSSTLFVPSPDPGKNDGLIRIYFKVKHRQQTDYPISDLIDPPPPTTATSPPSPVVTLTSSRFLQLHTPPGTAPTAAITQRRPTPRPSSLGTSVATTTRRPRLPPRRPPLAQLLAEESQGFGGKGCEMI